jgi:hypothetical protein
VNKRERIHTIAPCWVKKSMDEFGRDFNLGFGVVMSSGI